MMSSYLQRTLSKDERVLLQTKISLRRFLGSFVLGGAAVLVGTTMSGEYRALGLALVILGLLLIVPPIVRYFTNELALTNRRVVAKFGVVTLRTLEIRLEKIESIGVQQSVSGRLLNYGSVIITGTGGSRDPMPDIPEPVEFRLRFAEALEELAVTQNALAAARPMT